MGRLFWFRLDRNSLAPSFSRGYNIVSGHIHKDDLGRDYLKMHPSETINCHLSATHPERHTYIQCRSLARSFGNTATTIHATTTARHEIDWVGMCEARGSSTCFPSKRNCAIHRAVEVATIYCHENDNAMGLRMSRRRRDDGERLTGGRVLLS